MHSEIAYRQLPRVTWCTMSPQWRHSWYIGLRYVINRMQAAKTCTRAPVRWAAWAWPAHGKMCMDAGICNIELLHNQHATRQWTKVLYSHHLMGTMWRMQDATVGDKIVCYKINLQNACAMSTCKRDAHEYLQTIYQLLVMHRCHRHQIIFCVSHFLQVSEPVYKNEFLCRPTFL